MSPRRTIPAPDPTPPRLTAVPLPPYRYVPGHHPHPFRHPGGFAYVDGMPPVAPAWSPCRWQDDDLWLRGLELLEHRHYWACHEVLEGMWHQVEDDDLREVVQAVIQGAAAALRAHMGDARSAAILRQRALEHLWRVQRPTVHGLRLDLFRVRLAETRPYPQILDCMETTMTRVVRVVAAVVRREDTVCVARRAPHTARGGLWEFPGGKVEPGEDDRQALGREIHEELGWSIAVGEHLATAVHAYDDITIALAAYGATGALGAPTLVDHAEVRWVGAEGLDDLEWAPADVPLLPAIKTWLARPG